MVYKLQFHHEKTFNLAAHILTEYKSEIGIGVIDFNFLQLTMEFVSSFSFDSALEELEIAQMHNYIDFKILH